MVTNFEHFFSRVKYSSAVSVLHHLLIFITLLFFFWAVYGIQFHRNYVHLNSSESLPNSIREILILSRRADPPGYP